MKKPTAPFKPSTSYEKENGLKRLRKKTGKWVFKFFKTMSSMPKVSEEYMEL